MSISLVQSSGINSAAQFITILLVFIFVLIITCFTTRLIGKYQKVQSNSKNFETIEAHKLSGNTYLELVRIADKYYVMSVSKDSASLVCEVNEEELELGDTAPSTLDGFSQFYSKAKEKFSNKGDK